MRGRLLLCKHYLHAEACLGGPGALYWVVIYCVGVCCSVGGGQLCSLQCIIWLERSTPRRGASRAPRAARPPVEPNATKPFHVSYVEGMLSLRPLGLFLFLFFFFFFFFFFYHNNYLLGSRQPRASKSRSTVAAFPHLLPLLYLHV